LAVHGSLLFMIAQMSSMMLGRARSVHRTPGWSSRVR